MCGSDLLRPADPGPGGDGGGPGAGQGAPPRRGPGGEGVCGEEKGLDSGEISPAEKGREERRETAGDRDYERDPALEARYRQLARRVIGQRVSYFAAKMGVTCGRISIREQKTRWGSCSGQGNLNFNWKLILMPPEILDYVVVHELAHRKQMNHSPAFWAEVERILPDWRERRRWLREKGGEV